MIKTIEKRIKTRAESEQIKAEREATAKIVAALRDAFPDKFWEAWEVVHFIRPFLYDHSRVSEDEKNKIIEVRAAALEHREDTARDELEESLERLSWAFSDLMNERGE
jgi:DNA-directed RNA polymerase specialized sigma subunit